MVNFYIFGDSMLRILLANSSPTIETQLKKAIGQRDVQIAAAAAKDLPNESFDALVFDLGKTPLAALPLLETWRKQDALCPLAVIADSAEFFSFAYGHWGCWEYLVQPINAESFARFLARLDRFLPVPQQRLLLQLPGESLLLPVEELLFIEASGRKVLLHSLQGIFTLNCTLKQAAEACRHTPLLQVHRAYLINPRYLQRIVKKGDTWEAAFTHGTACAYVGRRYRKVLMAHLAADAITLQQNTLTR